MAETILLGLAIAFAVIWTGNWLLYAKESRGHSHAIVEVILLWILVVYFFINPTISRYHLIWAAPMTFICGFFISGLLMRYTRDASYSNKLQDVEYGNTSAKGWYEKGHRLTLSGNFTDAIAAFTKAIKQDKYFAEAFLGRGVCYYKKGNLEKAKNDIAEAAELGNTDAQEFLQNDEFGSDAIQDIEAEDDDKKRPVAVAKKWAFVAAGVAVAMSVDAAFKTDTANPIGLGLLLSAILVPLFSGITFLIVWLYKKL